jgi:ethanolamine transporter EutH
MNNIILKNGLIAGVIVSAFMVIGTYICYQDPLGFKPSYIYGFSGMLLAFLFVFIGIKHYRDKVNKGFISFGKALYVGNLIVLIASLIYVGSWLIEYYLFVPDFMEKYTAFEINTIKLSGASALEIAAKTNEMASYNKWYQNPFYIVLLTLMEIVPLGSVIAIISAFILMKKKSEKLIP